MEIADTLFKSRSVVWNHPKDVSRQFYFTQEMDRLVEKYDYEDTNISQSYNNYLELLFDWKNTISDKDYEDCEKSLDAAMSDILQKVKQDSKSRYYRIRGRLKDITTSNEVTFNNPYEKETASLWHTPETCDNDVEEKALSPLADYPRKAMQLFEQGDTLAALGICFDLLDRLIVLFHESEDFFDVDKHNNVLYAQIFVEVVLHVILHIYTSGNISDDVHYEIEDRLYNYQFYYTFWDEYNFYDMVDDGSYYEDMYDYFYEEMNNIQ